MEGSLAGAASEGHGADAGLGGEGTPKLCRVLKWW